MIVDASALVAMAVEEPESPDFATRVEQAGTAMTHPISVYEAAIAISRVSRLEVDEARDALSAFLRASNISVVEIGPVESAAALDAFDRFGKGRHPAALNMGDCFSYACARLRGMPLLFKGEDFSQTDITAA